MESLEHIITECNGYDVIRNKYLQNEPGYNKNIFEFLSDNNENKNKYLAVHNMLSKSIQFRNWILKCGLCQIVWID